MNQYLEIKLVITKESRPYQLSIMPGYEWSEILAVLDEFKVEVEKMREASVKVHDEEKSAESNPV